MGGTRWSDSHYHDRASLRAKTGDTVFSYDAATRKKGDYKAHPDMNPKDVKNRESRDSDAHPESRAVAVLFDVTGSMASVPRILQENLPKLMGLLLRKNYLAHPQIMVGAIGDATCDRAPLQVGQFESGIEIEDCIGKLFLEQGGGGHITESYELAMYFMSRHTELDCLNKRNQRGFLFIIGDETPYSEVNKNQVSALIGDTLQENIPLAELVDELDKKYDVYFILPKMTSNWANPKVHSKWVELLGQNVLRLEEPAGVCELIASTIGIAEGIVDIDGVKRDLHDAGSGDVATAVTGALTPYAASRGSAISVPSSGEKSGLVKI